MEKIINKLINEFTQGVDTYTHNGSTWLIFTETKQWVIELTDSKTLWYNYNFFKGIFSYTSMDVVEHQSYITKWVEDNIINGVKRTMSETIPDSFLIEDTLENGVKKTKGAKMKTDWSVEDTIENGVRHTNDLESGRTDSVEDTLQNGVIRTFKQKLNVDVLVEDIIQDGVKETIECDWNIPKNVINEVVNDGVKETNHVDVMKFFDNKMEDTLENGVKETKQKNNALLILDTSGRELILESHLVVRDGVKETSHRQFLKTYDVKDTIQDGTEHDRWILDGCDDPIDEVLDNGVKITASLQSREYTGDIDEVLDNGVRNSHPLIYRTKDMIDKVIDKGIKETHREICEYKETIEYIIQTGVKETHDDVYHHKGRIDGVINNGVKETKTPGNGDLVSYVEWMEENNSNSYPKMIDDVIENGVKEIYNKKDFRPRNIDDIIDNGEKINGTYAGGQRQSEKCKSVVEYGTKNPTY